MDSKYGNIWDGPSGEWFCANGHEIGITDADCAECAEDAYMNGEDEDAVGFGWRQLESPEIEPDRAEEFEPTL